MVEMLKVVDTEWEPYKQALNGGKHRTLRLPKSETFQNYTLPFVGSAEGNGHSHF